MTHQARTLASLLQSPVLVRTFRRIRFGWRLAAFLPFFRFLFLFSLLGSVALSTLEAVIRSERHALSWPLSEPNWNVGSCS